MIDLAITLNKIKILKIIKTKTNLNKKKIKKILISVFFR